MCIHSRNLSFNDLRTWKVNPTNELQGMKKLDVTGNEHWLPRAQILQLSNLTTVEGVSLSQYCQYCSLCKKTSHDVNSSCSRGRRLSSPSDWQWPDEIQYGRALDFVKLGFWPTCLADDVCMIDQYDLPHFTSLDDVTIKSSFAVYATGSAALLVNFAVVVFIALHKSLRNDLAVRLLLNVAVCDALIALANILCKRFNVYELYMECLLDQLQGKQHGFNAFWSEWAKLVKITGAFLTCAVASQVFGSAIAMLDKFLKIVFAMKPEVRLGSKAAALSLCSSWSLSATFAVLPVFGIGGMTYTGPFSMTPLPSDGYRFEDGRWNHSFGFAAGSVIALVLLQLASFLLYVPIFIVAKKSGANVGVKREAAIARKIALLLCTNLIFFTVPVVIGIFRSAASAELHNNVNDDWRSFTLAQVQWFEFIFDVLPVLCLSISSLLNPFLYALRHPKVKQQLNPLLSHRLAATRECFGILRQNLRCHTAHSVEATNNEVEMLGGRIPEHGSLAQEGNSKEESQRIPPQCPTYAGGINKVESEDTRDSSQQHAQCRAVSRQFPKTRKDS